MRQPVIAGCGFCRTLADGIYGSIYLYEHYDLYQATLDQDTGIPSGEDADAETMEDPRDATDGAGLENSEEFREEGSCDEVAGA